MHSLDSAASGGDASLILHEPVRPHADGLALELGGRLLPLRMQDETVRSFLPGWRALLLYTGFAPLFLLELAHEDGRRATWFLDFRMQRIADAVDRLGPELIGLLRQQAAPVLQQMMHAILHRCAPGALDAGSLAFLQLNEATRRAIGLGCLDQLMRRPSRLLVEELMPSSLMFRSERNAVLHAIERSHLAAGLAVDWQDRLAPAFRQNALFWPSPVDGAPLRAQGCLCIDDFHFAFRFADQKHGLVFFVVIAEHYSRVGGVWFPSLGLMVTPAEERTSGIAQIQLLPHLAHWVVSHVCVWAGLLVPYLDAGAGRFASVMRGKGGVHIGHQLWNELSGIDRLLQAAPMLQVEGALPEWIVLNAEEDIELYGPLEQLFPALQGRVNRTLPDVTALIRHGYEQGIMMLRVTREHVSRRLRERILADARASAAAGSALARLPEQGRPVILLGLRVENRTLVDLGGFLERLVGFIAEHFPDAAIVLDGHNSRGKDGRTIESHGESRAARSPLQVERQLAERLRQRFQHGAAMLVDTIGQPIAASLVWAERCDCFVSVWGASLAKYRWVCNKPGYVLTSRHNLGHRADLHIYDASSFTESPTPLCFIPPELVTDRPEAPLLVDVAPGQQSFFNFEVDEAALFPQIAALIRRSMGHRA